MKQERVWLLVAGVAVLALCGALAWRFIIAPPQEADIEETTAVVSVSTDKTAPQTGVTSVVVFAGQTAEATDTGITVRLTVEPKP